MAEEMTSVTPPTSPFAGMLGSTTYTEEERGVDFGVAPVIDSGAHVWGAMQDVAKFATNFYSNIKGLEFERKKLDKQEAAKKAEKEQRARRAMAALMVELSEKPGYEYLRDVSHSLDPERKKMVDALRAAKDLSPWLQRLYIGNLYRRPQ